MNVATRLSKKYVGKLPDGEIRAEVMAITPEMAAAFLEEAQGHNFRDLREPKIIPMARAMNDGRWHMNGTSIKFNSIGIMVDGQHRCAACVRAGDPFKTLVLWNVDDVSAVDSGFKRELQDYLRNLDCPNALQMAAALREVAYLETNPINSVVKTIDELLDMYHEYGTRLHAHVRAWAATKTMKSTMAAVTFLGTPDDGYGVDDSLDNSLVNEFIAGIKTGENLSKGDPRLALMSRLRMHAMPQRRMTKLVYRAVVIKAWNHWVNGSSISAIGWRSTGKTAEPFPRIAVAPSDF